jgi:hypothetical protein
MWSGAGMCIGIGIGICFGPGANNRAQPAL